VKYSVHGDWTTGVRSAELPKSAGFAGTVRGRSALTAGARLVLRSCFAPEARGDPLSVMGNNRLFFPQQALDGWLSSRRAELSEHQLVLREAGLVVPGWLATPIVDGSDREEPSRGRLAEFLSSDG
jgi:hypothetical protein